MIGRFAEEAIVRMIETTYIEDFLPYITGTPGTCLCRRPDMIVFSSGLPIALYNGVLGPRMRPTTLKRRFDAVMSFFQAKGIPMSWTLGPSTHPPELEPFLLSQGISAKYTYTGMAIDLRDVRPEPLPPKLTIQKVVDERSLREFTSVTAKGFKVPNNATEGWKSMMDRLWNESGFEMFLGLLDGRPVSTSMLAPHHDVGSVYFVTTLEEAREKGIGSAMTREPLLRAKRLGMELGVLEASESGHHIYQRLGFRELCEFGIFEWNP